MSNLMKKIKRSMVMLLVCSLLVGSVPMNAFAAEVDQNETVVNEESTEGLDHENEEVVEETIDPSEEGETETDRQLADGSRSVMLLSNDEYAISIVENEWVTIEFTEGCTQTGDGGETMSVIDRDLEFSVSLKEEVKDSHKIDGVYYKVGEDGAESIISSYDGITYSIPAGLITDRVEIRVEVSEIEYEVLFTIDSATVEKVTGDGEEAVTYQNDERVIFKKGETLSFTVSPQGDYVVKYVCVYETETQELYPDADGVYHVVIDKDKHIGILAGQKTTTTVFWTGTNMQVEGFNFDIVAEDKDNYNHTVTEGDTIYFRVLPDTGYRVVSVTDASGVAIEPEDSVYALVGKSVDQYLTVTTEEDESFSYQPKVITVSENELVTVNFSSGCTQTDGEGNLTTVESEDVEFTVSLKAEAGEEYEIGEVCYLLNGKEYVVGNGSGSHVIRNAEITDAIEIVVRVRPASYEVIFEDEFVDITFVGNCTTTDENGIVKTIKDRDLEFQVSLKEEVADSHQIDGVYYKVGKDGAESIISASNGITYSIPAGHIMDQVEIRVQVSEIECEVLFTIDSATVEKVVGDGEEAVIYQNDDRVMFKKGETLSFTVKPQGDYVVKYVYVYETETQELTPDTNGVYHVVIDKDKHIGILAGQKNTTTVSWTGTNMKVEGFYVEITQDDKDNYHYEVEEGETVYYRIVADMGYRVVSVVDENGNIIEPVDGVYILVGTNNGTNFTVITEEDDSIVYVPKAITVEENDLVTIEFANGCTQTDSQGKMSTVKFKDVEFAVGLKEEAGDEYEIAEVSYILNGEEYTVGYGSGSHVIRNAEITGAIKIKVRVIPTSYEIIYENEFVDITFVGDCTKTDENGVIKTIKDRDLEFRVSLKAEVADSHKIDGVYYKVGKNGAEGRIDSYDGITYSIPTGHITDRVEIRVEASEIKYEVLFTIMDAVVTKVPKAGERAVTYKNDQKVLFKKGDVLSFKAMARGDYVVRYVYVYGTTETQELTPDENGVYHVVIDENKHIGIVAGQKASTTVFWTGEKMQIQGVNFKPVTESKESYNYVIKEGDKIQFKVVGDIGFRALTVIDGNETVIEPDSNGRYTLVGTTEDQYISVTMEQFALTEDKTFQFANQADKVTYKVDTSKGSGVTQNIGKTNMYTLAAGTEYLKYTVTVPAHYGATVTADGFALGENEVIQPSQEAKTYEYALRALDMTGQVVRIDDYCDTRELVINYDSNKVELSAVSAGMVSTEFEESGSCVSVDYGTTIDVTVKAKGNYGLTSVKTTISGSDGKEDTSSDEILNNAESYKFTIKATENYTYDIVADAMKYVVITAEDEEKCAPENGVYIISAGKAYTVEIYKENEYFDITKAELYCNGKLQEAGVSLNNDGGVDININDNATKENDMELRLTTQGETDTESGEPTEEITSVSLKVLPIPTSITVTGVKNATIKQAADIRKEYDIALKPASAAKTLEVAIENDTEGIISEAGIENGKLYLVTNPTDNYEADATVIVYNNSYDSQVNEENGEEVYYSDISKDGIIKVSVAEPKLTQVKPNVSLADASNTTLTLNLGAKGMETPIQGKIWYEINAVPVNAEQAEQSGPHYFEYCGDSQIETVAIADAELEGTLPAVKYNVSVSLVQTDSEEAPNEGGCILFKTNEKKINILKNAATKVPYYETKLTLKKGTTTIFTGQENIVVATPNFSKQTTYKDLTLTVARKNDPYGYVEGISCEYEDGKIYVHVADGVQEGSYTLTAATEVPDGVKAATASVDFAVVYGINKIQINVPDKVYKEDNKAASFAVNYNVEHYNETEGSSFAPYKNKVILSIAVLDEEGNEITDSPLLKAVTVKSGKVTVAKDYIIDGTEFVIKAKADDYKENTCVAYSEPIQMVNETLTLGRAAFVKYNAGNSCYDVIEPKDGWYYFDDIENTQVVVFKKGVEEKSGYESSEFQDLTLGRDEFTFTSNKKELQLDSDGTISGITKEVKGAKITVTIKDGSGSKTELSGINIKGSQDELELTIEKLNEYGESEIMGTIETTLNQEDGIYYGKFNGVQKSLLAIKVNNVTMDSYDFPDKGVNFKVSFANAKTITANTAEGQGYYVIEPTKKEVTITLENKNLGKKITYILTNEAIKDGKLPTIKSLKAEGSFVQNNPSVNKVKLILPAEYNGDYVKLSPDNTKMNKDDKYQNFICCLDNLGGIFRVENNTVEISLRRTGEGDYVAPQYSGTYKLSVCVGEVNDEGVFVTKTANKDVSVKVSSVKAVAPKLIPSYKLNLKDGNRVELKTNLKDIYIEATGIENCNIKGTPNHFTDYFEVIDGRYLELKEDADVDYLLSKSGKNDLTGWVNYDNGAAQVTISLKEATSFSYSITNASVVEGDSEAGVTVTKKNGNAFSIYDVYCSDCEISMDDDSNEADGDYRLLLDISDETKFKPGATKSVTVYVVDDSVCEQYKEKIYNSDEEDRIALLKKYGMKLTTKITILKTDKAKSMDKIKLTSSNVTLAAGNYENEKYSVVIKCNQVIDKLTDYDMVDNLYQSFIECEYNNGELKIAVDKADFLNAIEAKEVAFGEKIKVSFIFDFGEYGKETETVTLTLPKKPQSAEELVAKLRAAGIENISLGAFYVENFETAKEQYISNLRQILQNVIPNDVAYECDIICTEPTKEENGSVITTICLENLEDGEEPYTFTRELVKLNYDVGDLREALVQYLSSEENRSVSSNATVKDILETLRTAMGMSDQYPNLRLMLGINDYQAPTEANDGYYDCVFTIKDIIKNESTTLESRFVVKAVE